jgi:two-component sensor histidine kinase
LSDTSEYGVVAENLNRMMDELQHNERQREILSRELEHRVKNMLTTVQAIAGMSFGQSTSQADLQTFLNRLKALGDGYSALRTDQWKAAALSDVVARAMAPLGGTTNGRLVIEGPPVHLDSSQVLAVSMVLHELGTNAVKYGALSNGHGKISIMWSRENGAVRLTWSETDGPAVTPPSATGFGTRLIQAFGKELGDAELHYDSTGLRCTILISATPAPDV